jgi:uncharacterized protein (TIGR03083 family)
MTALDDRMTDTATIAPLGHQDGLDLFAVELQRSLDLMRKLSEPDWASQTECPDWDVRRMYLHVLGACESGASIRELIHQMRTAMARRKREGGPLEAALSATQVVERIDLSPGELTARFAAVAPVTVRKRRGLPALLRKARMAVDGPVVEKWTLGYLVDVIYLRDGWMHRVDVCRATGRSPVLTPQHDGRIVADVVAEWARRHGRPFTLTLTGPAGGAFTGGGGDASASMTLDAVEFCRTLSGRTPGSGLLATIVPF